jgi:hypothetical protein
MHQKLLDAFRGRFDGVEYRHRSSTHGDIIAAFLYEDLYDLNQDRSYHARADLAQIVYNKANRVVGKVNVRRGDGLLGQVVPGQKVRREAGFAVARSRVANIQIGAEVKIVSTAMGKQLDRVMGDITKQCRIFHKVSSNAVTVAVVGVNFSSSYRSYEGERHYDSSPAKEASQTLSKIASHADLHELYDEVLILPFTATNVPPFPFAWKNWSQTSAEYNAALVRINNEYHDRFP